MQSKQRRMLGIGYLLVIFICFLPLLPGVLGMVIPAFGFIPPLGLNIFTFDGFMSAISWPGVERSLLQTTMIAVVSTIIAVIMTFAILQAYWEVVHGYELKSYYPQFSRYLMSLSRLVSSSYSLILVG